MSKINLDNNKNIKIISSSTSIHNELIENLSNF